MFDILLDDILEVKFWYTCGNDRALNVRHYQVTAVSDPVGILTSFACATQLFNLFEDEIVALMSEEASFDAISVQRLGPLPRSVLTLSAEPAVNGTLISSVLPRQVTGLISLYTEFGGERNRGRFYMPYPSETDNDGYGVPGAAYMLNLWAMRTQLVIDRVISATVGDMTMTPVLLHRDGGPVTTITAGVARTKWATQRRRQNGRF